MFIFSPTFVFGLDQVWISSLFIKTIEMSFALSMENKLQFRLEGKIRKPWRQRVFVFVSLIISIAVLALVRYRKKCVDLSAS